MKTFKLLVAGIATILLLSSNSPKEPNTLSVELSSTAPSKGVIRLALFDTAEGLKSEQPLIGKVISFSGADVPLSSVLTDLPSGCFALAAYHDLNNNGKLDRNIFGVPSEPYGFSGQPTSKWRAPTWEEVVQVNTGETQKIQLQLRYWKEI